MPTRHIDEVKASVQTLAQQVADQIGGRLENPFTNVVPCTGKRGESGGKDVVSIGAGWQIPLPTAQHSPTATKLRTAWKQAGWTIKVDMDNGGKIRLDARTPDDYDVMLASTTPPTAVSLQLSSPCFRPAATDGQSPG